MQNPGGVQSTCNEEDIYFFFYLLFSIVGGVLLSLKLVFNHGCFKGREGGGGGLGCKVWGFGCVFD